MSKTVMIVSGESSGELYGSLLTSRLKSLWPDVRVLGVGGQRMRQAGVEVVAGVDSTFGFIEAIPQYKAVKRTYKKTVDAMLARRPDVLVLIDYPDFNFRVGKIARKNNITVLYYVSPQVWAWRPGRINTIAGFADKMAVLLPFEEGIYTGTGLDCEFVGHPALDEINNMQKNREFLCGQLGLDNNRRVIALLPGSRRHELNSLLPVILEVVKRSKVEFPGYDFILPLAPNLDMQMFSGMFDELKGLGVTLTHENAVMALSVADAAVIASGTAALQSALVGTPHMVIYKISPISYFIDTIVGQEFIMRACFGNPAFVKNYNAVSPHYSREPVGYYYCGALVYAG